MREYFWTVVLIAGAALGAGIIAYSIIGAKNGEVVIAFSATDDFPEGVAEITLSLSDVIISDEEGNQTTVANKSTAHLLTELASSGRAIVLERSRAAAGEYPFVHVTIDSIVVTEENGSVSEVIAPETTYVIPAKSLIQKGAVSTITIDFSAERSLRRTTEGVWISLPVMRIETRSKATAIGAENASLEIANGDVVANGTFGSAPDGTVRENFAFPQSIQLFVENGTITEREASTEPSFPSLDSNEPPAELPTSTSSAKPTLQ